MDIEVRNSEIIRLKNEGYSTQEIYDMNFLSKSGKALSKRYIQMCIKSDQSVDFNGKITDTQLFSLRDLENISKDPALKEKIIQKRVDDYNRRLNEKNLEIKTDTKSKYQAKLRANVFKRDGYKCVECGSNLGLECHHKSHHEFKSLDDEIRNCETLCYKCHRELHI